MAMCSLWNFANREELRKIFSSLIQNFQITKVILALANPGSGYCQLREDHVYSHSWHVVLGSALMSWPLRSHCPSPEGGREGSGVSLTCPWAPSLTPKVSRSWRVNSSVTKEVRLRNKTAACQLRRASWHLCPLISSPPGPSEWYRRDLPLMTRSLGSEKSAYDAPS